MIQKICIKCGRIVNHGNDARVIGEKVFPFWESGLAKEKSTLHFLPVYEKDSKGNTILVCKGSPYRAQYIEGQPCDKRGYPYHKEQEERWREALRQAQEEEVKIKKS